MEETLGKRIAAHRRRLGLTQDRLAELLGVTAQAVSKWENDQSCPDISLLPKLSEVFGCTTDSLLGIEKAPTCEGELVPTSPEPENPKGVCVDTKPVGSSRKTAVLIALWVLLTGGLLFLPQADFWGVCWRAGLLIFGLGGLLPHFSLFRLTCALFGGFLLMNHLFIYPEIFNRGLEWMLPVFLLLFGLHLLVEALRKPGKIPIGHMLPGITRENRCDMAGEAFDCATTFGENNYRITLPRLSRGTAAVSFGSMTVDLGGCEEIGDGCTIDLRCSFGELTLLVPRSIRAVPDAGTVFGNVEVIGAPASDTQNTIAVRCGVRFGQITLRYV